MPARRSRTHQWRRCLKEVFERNGALEIAIARHYEEDGEFGRHLVWRVRILELNDDNIVIEQPMVLGETIELLVNLELVVVLSIGQNRWTFHSHVLEQVTHELSNGKPISAMRITLPDKVERCQRRNYYRVKTAEVKLPEVDVWPLLDPKSVVLAERANEIEFAKQMDDPDVAARLNVSDPDGIMPEVGPKFVAQLLNVGGGGLGLRVSPDHAQSLTRQKVFWLRLQLPPELTTPVCATGKLIHTHIDSSQHTYAGFAFDFSFNPGHQQFVVDQICRYIALQQKAQLAHTAALQGKQRKSA